MEPAPLVYRGALAAAAAVCLGTAGYVWTHRPKPGTRPLAASLVGSTFWLVATLLSWSTADPATAMFWRKTTYLGILSATFLVAIFVLEYLGRSDLIRPSVVGVLLAPPVVLNALVWTNPSHGLVWATATTPGTPATFEYGPAFWGVVAYAYLVILGVVALMVRVAARTGSYYRSQIAAISVGVATPILSNAVFLVTGAPYDLAPLGFAVTGVALAYASVHRSFLDLGPVARDRLIAEMTDPVLVVDRGGRVVDANPSLVDLVDDPSPVGRPIRELIGIDPTENPAETDQLTLRQNRRPVHYDVRVTPLGSREPPLGYLVVLRNVTDLTRRESELDMTRRVMSRFIRHNLRNDLNVVLNNASVIAEAGDEDVAERARSIRNMGADILAMSDKARTVESVLDASDERHALDLTNVVERAVGDVTEAHPDLEVDVDAPREAWVSANLHLSEAIVNLLENAVEHNDARPPKATVRVDRGENVVHLTIEDNGPGIPRTEIEAVQERQDDALQHGSGIGLYLVTWIVEKSGGSVEFDGPASRVRITLPAGSPPEDDR